MKHNSLRLKIFVLLLAAALFGSAAQDALAAVPLTGQVSMGSSGSNVSNLQSFLATNSSIYPQGLVTGYFGPLTRQAVMNFQTAYDISPVGNVGPLTLAAINRVIAAGYGIDVSGPQIFGPFVSMSASRQATISWTTNEAASAKVFYDTRPITAFEASQSFTSPIINASFVGLSSGFSGSQSVVLQNLTPGTLYYYMVQSTDASGNVSVTTQRTFTAI